jgi:integrase
MAKMTVQQLQALSASNKPYKRAVDTGLLVRVTPSGKKTWIVQYVVDGKQYDFPLDKPWGLSTDGGHLSLKDARTESENIRALARQGVNYRFKLELERKEEADRIIREAAAEALRKEKEDVENKSVKDLFLEWLRDGVSREDKNAEIIRSFNKDVLPEIGVKPVKALTEHDIRKLLRKIADRGVRRYVVATFRNLTQMFAWGEKRQPWRKLLAEGNPVQLINIQTLLGSDYDLNNRRTRCLLDTEIVQLHKLLESAASSYEVSDSRLTDSRPIIKTTELAIWIMLSTLCRVGELLRARWENVDLEKGEWFIPKAETKGKKQDFMIFLSPFAIRHFKKLKIETGATAWCFPAANKEGHVCVKSVSKQIGDRQASLKNRPNGNVQRPMKNRAKAIDLLVLAEGKNGNWTPHDLRRTGATKMQSLGIPEEIIDRCQNHVVAGPKIRRHYLHYQYAEEKRDAWNKLGEALDQIIPCP